MKKLLIVLSALLLLQYSNAQTCGTVNLALNKAVTASSEGPYNSEEYAVDGSSSVSWKTAAVGPQYLIVDLGQSYTICRISLTWPQSATFATHYELRISNVNNDWANASILKTETASNGNGDDISVSGTGRYVRLYMTEAEASWASFYELLEIEIYESTGSSTPPTVSVTSPVANATFTPGNNIVISANASSSDGVERVIFQRNGTNLFEDTQAPYTYTWNNVPAGTYTVTATVVSNGNVTVMSTPVSIAVTSNWQLGGNSGTTAGTHFIGTQDAQGLQLKTNNTARITILPDGKVGVNTITPPADFSVNGDIWAKKLKVTQTGWADYVFDSAYKLLPLHDVAKFIQQNKHLPDVPSAKEVEQSGLNVGDNQAVLLRKIEELTLYLIEQDKRIRELEANPKSKKQRRKN